MIHGLRFADDWGQEESDETFKCKTWQKLFVVYGHTSRTKHTAYGLSTVVTITIHFSFFLTTMNNLQNIVCNSLINVSDNTDSDTLVALKQGQSHQTWYESVDPEPKYNHEKFERP